MSGSAAQPGLSQQTTQAVHDILAGRRRGLRAILPLAGPAFICSIAYVDPGNFATNIQAGARYGYGLLWVVLLASAVAMLFQALSARIGIATNRNLAELCREHFPRSVVIPMWVASEVAAMATDLAEFLGGAIGLAILFHLPLLAGMALTAVATFAMLDLQRRGFRPLELLIGGFVAVIGLCYVFELVFAPPDWHAALLGTIRPTLPDAGALALSVGIVGATVMPHAIYLHSSLTQDRAPARCERERRALIGYSNAEVMVALGLAALVNMAMVMMAAHFHAGHDDVAEIQDAYQTLVPLFGAAAGAVFMVSLVASGLSSSVVGTMAGQVVMQGFVGLRIPVWVRRVVTMAPSFVVVACGMDATTALVASQVVLSLVLPIPMLSLLILIRRPAVMGASVPGRPILALAAAATILVAALNVVLVLQTIGVPIPGLA